MVPALAGLGYAVLSLLHEDPVAKSTMPSYGPMNSMITYGLLLATLAFAIGMLAVVRALMADGLSTVLWIAKEELISS